MNIIQDVRRKLQPLDVINVLGTIHLALVTDAGLLIMYRIYLVLAQFGDQLGVEFVDLALLVGYVIFDLSSLRFPRRFRRFLREPTISLGFPFVFLSLLVDYPNVPFKALLIAILGSLISEALRSRAFSKQPKQRLPWGATLRRAFFYAGHHAVAGLGALIAYRLICKSFASWLGLDMIHIQATLVYFATYSLVSMLLIWPHDRRIQLFLASDEEPFVRVDLLATPPVLIFPAFVFRLYDPNLGQIWTRNDLMIGLLLPILLLGFQWAVRGFIGMTEENEQYKLREEIEQHLGPTITKNMTTMAERVLETIGKRVEYRRGAVYSLSNGKMELKRCGTQSHRGAVVFLDPSATEVTETTSEGTTANQDAIMWPRQFKSGEGVLGGLAEEYFPPRFFNKGLAPATSSDLHLPRRTALMVLPIPAGTQGERGAPRQLEGVVVLARPRKLFTLGDWEQGQALINGAGELFRRMQRVEETARELTENVEDYIEDPETVHLVMQELIVRGIEISRIFEFIRERSLRENLPAMLQSLAEGKASDRISLAPETLPWIYTRVREETAAPVMPPLDADVFQLLQTVTSSLPLVFSLGSQSAAAMTSSAFKEFCEFLLNALNANTVRRIVALDVQITATANAVQGNVEAVEAVRKLADIVHLLKEYRLKEDPIAQRAFLGHAMNILIKHERSAQDKLQGSLGIVFPEITSVWRVAVTDALEDMERGPAQLKVSLCSDRALPLEEITVGIALQNRGPGIASEVVVQLEPSQAYDVLEGQVYVGTLVVGKEVASTFTLRPKEDGPLRLQFHITYDDPEREGKIEEFADLLYLQEPPSPYTEITNPYTPGPPLEPGDLTFAPREDVFDFIRQNIVGIASKKVLALVGGRRTGKTSILKHLPVWLDDGRYIPIFIDCQALVEPGIENFLLILALDIARGLKKLGVHVPRLTLSELGESPQHVFQQRFLPIVREEIGEERILLLALDEFDHLGRLVKEGSLPATFFPYLRHLIQHEQQLAFILAGTDKMEEAIGDYWSVLFNIAVYKKIGHLNRSETIDLIREPVRPYGMVYDDLAVDEMLRLTACHPYFTQMLCYILVNRCNKAHRSYVTTQGVRDAEEELLQTGHAHLRFIWGVSDPVEKLTLAALGELQGRLGQVTGSEIVDRLASFQIDLDPGQVIKAMEGLAARDIVCEVSGYQVSYEFTTRLYAHWLRLYKPLSKVVEEIHNELTTG